MASLCNPFSLRFIASSYPQEFLEGRDAPPPQHSFKIQNFSLLSAGSVEKVSSDRFDAGDYKWKLIIYPKGDKNRDGQDHISIYLALADTNTLPAAWEVNVIFNLFVFDQVIDKYFGRPDGRVRRFHAMKTEWGFPKLIDLKTFTNRSNGFLVDDTCVFGAEVFVLKQARKGECLSLIEKPITCNHIWRIKNFASLTSERYESESFVGGDYKWKVRLYPNGNGEGKGNSISLFLCLEDSTLPSDTKLFTKFILRVMDQTGSEHAEFKTDHMFGPSVLVWGSPKILSLAKFKDLKKGFLAENLCIIEAQLTVLGLVNTV